MKWRSTNSSTCKHSQIFLVGVGRHTPQLCADLEGSVTTAVAAANSNALTIAPATLTYTADAASRIYGAANPVLGGTTTGFVGSDTLASATTGTPAFTSAPGTNAKCRPGPEMFAVGVDRTYRRQVLSDAFDPKRTFG
jgi:hypothetical protein